MSSDRHFSTRRLLGTSGLFIGILMLILLMGSHAPFGLSFADDAVNTHQLVRTEVVKFQDSYEMQRDFLGLVEVPQSSRLGFEITGKIDQLHYDEGDQVEAGEVMASLDTARLNAQYQEALAALKSARANATLAASTYQRFLNASRQSAVSEQEIDEAKETFDAATSQVDVSKARLKTIEVDLAKSKLLAPYAGTVVRRYIDVGTVASVSEPVFLFQELEHYQVRIGASRVLAQSLSLGQTLEIEIAGKKHAANVSAILSARNSARTVDVMLTLSAVEGDIFSGDVARLVQSSNISQRGFWVPVSALVEAKRGLWSIYVIVKSDQQDEIARSGTYVERRTVQVHYTDGQSAFISGAVKDNEQCVIEGAAKLVPNQPVKVSA